MTPPKRGKKDTTTVQSSARRKLLPSLRKQVRALGMPWVTGKRYFHLAKKKKK